ncbi:uncharacterized protein [Eurosta solidaginis]|uniref:uncharacterized protein n=1 Tax=Eurosta solidaginis TaxID=178769 RepID=UPI003530ACE4
MFRYTFKFAEQLKLTGRCLLCMIALILVISITAFALIQMPEDTMRNFDKEDNVEAPTKVVRVIRYNKPKAVNEVNSAKLPTNVETENRNKRDVYDVQNKQVNQSDHNSNTPQQSNYEEQQPVVVHAESVPTLGRRQDDFGAPPIDYHDPYYEPPPADYGEKISADALGGDETDGDPYAYGLRHPPGYYDDASDDDDIDDKNAYADYASTDDANDSSGNGNANVNEGRAAQNSAYDTYYKQWHYATPAPAAVPRRPNGGWEIGGNRKMQNDERDPYAAYDTNGSEDDYEYPGAPTTLQKQQYIQQQQQRQRQKYQQQPQNGPQHTTIRQQQQQRQQALQGVDTTNRPVTNISTTENPLVSTLKSLKTMWDIYQAFAAAWNMLGAHRQKQVEQQQQEQALKRRQQQITQQTRINSKKPPKFQMNDKYIQRNNTSNTDNRGGGASHVGIVDMSGAVIEATTAAKRIRTNNKAYKQPKTTAATTLAKKASKPELQMSSEVDASEDEKVSSSGSDSNKNVSTKSVALARQNALGKREKRQMSDTSAVKSTDVGEGRYIKGDPLKGYYDFVITEGSYKFWAVFQTGTALLIIYSTFAAIYYSKVNPLVSDYDYTDYLGGARALSGGGDGDADFIDDDSSGDNMERRHSWFDGMLPRAGRTMKYILEALDRLPVDHREADEIMKTERTMVAEVKKQIVEDKQDTASENDEDAVTPANANDSDLNIEQRLQIRTYAA